MLNRHDNLLRTDVVGFGVDEMQVARYHIADAAAADADGVMTAAKRVKTTAWEATAPTINISDDLSGNTIDIVGTPDGEKDVDIVMLL